MRITGPVRARTLLENDISRHVIRAALESGQLVRLRHGWYALADDQSEAAQAVKLGGYLAGLSACKHYGIWVPFDPKLYVARARRSPKYRNSPNDLVRFLTVPHPLERPVVPLKVALQQVINNHHYETVYMVMESAVNNRLIDSETAINMLKKGPRAVARRVRHFDPKAQSGLETRARLFFQEHRIKVATQVQIPRVGCVDLLVAGRWVIELDGTQFHCDSAAVTRDRRRDMEAKSQGFVCDRLSYSQLLETWERTREYLLQQYRINRRRTKPARAKLRSAPR